MKVAQLFGCGSNHLEKKSERGQIQLGDTTEEELDNAQALCRYHIQHG